jgi:hypothetical protein
VVERREELRAADVDRAFVAERLKAALDEGRLSLSEYDERLQRTYGSKTYGDLDQVMADLPHPAPPANSQLQRAAGQSGYASAPVGTPASGRPIPTWLSAVWGAWLVAVSVNVVIWLLVCLTTQSLIYPWPVWVAGPWGAVLLAMTLSGLMRGAPYAQADRRADRDARRQARRDGRRRG